MNNYRLSSEWNKIIELKIIAEAFLKINFIYD